MNERWSLPTRYFVTAVVVVLISLFLYYIRDLLRPLITAGFIAYLISPIVEFVSRKTKWSRKVAGNVVYFVTLALMIGLISSFIPMLISQATAVGDALNLVIDQIEPYLQTPINWGPFTLNLESVLPVVQGFIAEAGTPMLEDALQLVEATSRNVIDILLVFVVTYYFMTDWADIREWLLRLAPESSRNDMRRLYWGIRAVWMNYLRGQIVLMFVVGVVFTIIYLIIGLPGAIVIGVLTGLFTLVPDVGPAIGTAIAAIVALLEGSTVLGISNLLFAILVVAIYGVLIAIKNVWLRPFIMGRSVSMHEGLVFVAILGAVIYEGILGALIVVPVIASLAVIGSYLRSRMFGLPPFPDEKVSGQPSDDTLPPVSRIHPRLKSKEPRKEKPAK
jgi:predicted PurR-regulated permease PerM